MSKTLKLRVGIPSTIFFDGQFFLKTSQNFSWDLYADHWSGQSRDHIHITSGYGPISIPVFSLSYDVPVVFEKTSGLNFRIVITDERLLRDAFQDNHGALRFNEFLFPTVQFYCPRVPVSGFQRLWRSLWTTWITPRLFYRG